MESKVAKNTYLKPINLKVVFNCLSIKRLLEEQLSASVILLKNQVHLSQRCVSFTDINKRNSSWYRLKLTDVGYRCAIAYPLAAQLQLPVIDVAQHLVHCLSSLKEEVNNTQVVNFHVQVVEPGWIDFYPSDRTLAIWLQQLVLCESLSGEFFPVSPLPADYIRLNNILPFQYVHSRCCALLQLGHTEGFIELEPVNLASTIERWFKPNPIPWLHPETKVFQLQHPSEQVLINQFLGIVDAFTHSSQSNWVQLTTNLSAAMLDFYRNCRIWGKTKQNTPSLAQARLGLVAICQILLQQILSERTQLG